MVSALLPLVLEGVEMRRGGRRILGPLSLRIEGQGITIVMGPNGSGKTSLMRAMHGLERINAGRIRWNADLDTARARQAFVFQTPILMRRTVIDCIGYPLRLAGMRRAAMRERAAAIATEVGLGDSLDKRASALSGGERQKLALARALIRAPEVLFLDEPCANLDGRATRDIEAILLRARAGGTRIVMSTHDIGQARRLADDVVFLHHGRVIEAAGRRAFFESPRSAEVKSYLNGELLP